MKKKQFKAESKRLLNLMINSVYTNKDIFLREVISNSSDALDKIYFESLTNKSIKLDRKDLEINIKIDKDNRKITISDNGCGMTKDELENNLGTIAQSGSSLFKSENKNEDISIIGQFGVGFYSVFMVADKVEVYSKPYNSKEAYVWMSSGEDGFVINECDKKDNGTDIVIYIKEDDDSYEYSKYLDDHYIKDLIVKHSNYVHFPIKLLMNHKDLKEGSKDEYVEHSEIQTVNSMSPLWKKSKKSIKDEEYNDFYTSTFFDYDKPLHVINYNAEGASEFTSLLFIPSHAPYNWYAKDYKRGLQLYSNGVLIMDNCEELLPEHYGFVKGLVDSSDLSLNISREMLQQDKQLKLISSNIEKKINKELSNMLKNDREKYESFFKEFGIQLKMGIYNSFGMAKNDLQDLLLFYSSNEDKYVTLKEYVERMKEGQNSIYYATGESTEKIKIMPQVDDVKDKGYEILYLTESTDEFVIQVLRDYDNKTFMNISSADVNFETDEEKEKANKMNEKNSDLLEAIKSALKERIANVKFTYNLKKHPVCLLSEGAISTGMEKVLNAIPTNEKVNAQKVLTINASHPIAKKIIKIYKENPKEIDAYSKILYAQARLIDGLTIENPGEISDLICDMISK